jgi:hypothetical protein
MYRFVVIGYSGDAAQILVIVITDSGEADHGSERRQLVRWRTKGSD